MLSYITHPRRRGGGRTTMNDRPASWKSSPTCVIKCTRSLQQHTHTHLMALLQGLLGWAGTRKVKPIWILLKQETVSGSGISCAICKFAPRSRQITTPAPHHSVFVQAGCPSCRPTNSVKALKAHTTATLSLLLLLYYHR